LNEAHSDLWITAGGAPKVEHGRRTFINNCKEKENEGSGHLVASVGFEDIIQSLKVAHRRESRIDKQLNGNDSDSILLVLIMSHCGSCLLTMQMQALQILPQVQLHAVKCVQVH
jgi:hypothetical protein